LPLLFAFIVLVPCLLFSFDAFVNDYSLLALPLFALKKSAVGTPKGASLIKLFIRH
jgi:hypothetical protein